MNLRISDRGPEVALLRANLTEIGYAPGAEIENVEVFDASMDHAVRALQASYELVVDGIVGPMTLRVLSVELFDLRAPDPDLTAMDELSSHTALMAHRALRARVREVPLGTNRGPAGPHGGVDAYLCWHGQGSHYLRYVASPAAPEGWRGAPWCAAFVAWCASRASEEIRQSLRLRQGTDLMGCRKWQAAARRHELLLSDPIPGCVGLVLRDGKLAHAVLVTRIDARGIWSIEGNGHGDRVRAVLREASAFGALIRLG